MGGLGVILSLTTFLRQNGVAYTRPKKGDGKKKILLPFIPYVSLEDGDGLLKAAWHDNNRKMRKSTVFSFLFFLPPKFHAAQDEAKRRRGLILEDVRRMKTTNKTESKGVQTEAQIINNTTWGRHRGEMSTFASPGKPKM